MYVSIAVDLRESRKVRVNDIYIKKVRDCALGVSDFCFLTRMQVDKLSKEIYKANINDASAIKALAFYIYCREYFVNGASVLVNCSYARLQRATGLSLNTTKKRVRKLIGMGLIEVIEGRTGRNFVLHCPRAAKTTMNVDLSKLDKSSIKNIELGLKTLLICEIQRSKEWISQQILKATNPNEYTPLREIKKARRYCSRRGLTTFVDNGISWKTIAKKLGCGLNKVREILKYGEEHNFFVRHTHIWQVAFVKGGADEYVRYMDGNLFSTKRNNGVYRVSASTFTLLEG